MDGTSEAMTCESSVRKLLPKWPSDGPTVRRRPRNKADHRRLFVFRWCRVLCSRTPPARRRPKPRLWVGPAELARRLTSRTTEELRRAIGVARGGLWGAATGDRPRALRALGQSSLSTQSVIQLRTHHHPTEQEGSCEDGHRLQQLCGAPRRASAFSGLALLRSAPKPVALHASAQALVFPRLFT